MRKLLFLGLFGLMAAVTYAGGYRVSLQGQRSLAMGHTGVAVVNNAELAFFNPAGLVYLEDKINLAAGASAVFSNVKYQNSEFGINSETDSPVGTPFYAYGSYRVNDWLTLGLAAYTPYGSSVEWPADWAGSHLVNTIDLQAIYIQALAAVKISDKLSVGGGPIYVNGSVNFNRNLNRTLTDIDGNRANVTVDASGVSAFGWSASAMYNATEDLRFGINYRSEIMVEAEGGDADFQNIPNSPLTSFQDTQFDAALPMPAELSVGLSYELLDKWLFAFDYNMTYWDVYESLDIDFANATPDSNNPRNYKNSSTYRFGLQYLANETVTLRVGYYFDESPVQSGYFAPETPRNDAHGFTGGLSLHVNDKFSIDAAFLYNRYEEINESYDYYTENGESVPFEGTYKTSAFIPGLGVTYKL
ncbi:OmpP1/FadL family transporter [Salegentibacter salegens]|uniref:Long-chain fatty acid transport protein n=1 Tax=Salegentibacter salegens TaxID=143223 RepID=A0A1M7N027_9FLAO|nr:outer membrane protein transport protein [Salegentibacter salegens]PRX52429.1 long-chain fatty acid transport protein [Salegentibacter salegens]SHM96264.1 long-chain fatty acid transport protein [Salegentibacter salegens]